MESLIILIPVALVLVAAAVKLLLWAIDSGQYDDLDHHQHLFDEPQQKEPHDD